MLGTLEKRARRADERRRRREVEQLLADFGLRRGPRRLPGDLGACDDEPERVRRLRAALERLGPPFDTFGLYMATRADLLRAPDCLELSSIEEVSAPATFDEVEALIEVELGRPLEEVFEAFEESPFESRLLFQTHRARSRGGQPLLVKVGRPELKARLSAEAESLTLLSGAFGLGDVESSLVEDAVGDFRRELLLDFTHEAGALAALGRDAEEFDRLRAPAVYADLCSPNVLTTERLPGALLSRTLAFNPDAAGPSAREDFEEHDLAHTLCLVWLRQAMLGCLFPVELRAEQTVFVSDTVIAFGGGRFACLPAASRENLWGYLAAAARGDTDRACTYLVAELEPSRRRRAEDELRHRLRQIVPFRDGGWSERGASDTLAEHLFLHWRIASALGFRPQTHLRAFYRGLFTTAAAARRLTLERDALLNALGDVRVIAGVARLRDRLGPQQFGANSEKYAALVLEVPQRLDEALTLASGGGGSIKLQVPPGQGVRGRRSPPSVFTSLLVAAGAVALLAHRLVASGAVGAWGEGIGAAALLLFGVLILWSAKSTD